MISPARTYTNSNISPARNDTEFIISLASNSLSQYVQPPNSGHKYRSKLSVSVPTASSTVTAAPKQLPNLGHSLVGRQ